MRLFLVGTVFGALLGAGAMYFRPAPALGVVVAGNTLSFDPEPTLDDDVCWFFDGRGDYLINTYFGPCGSPPWKPQP